MSYTKAKPIKVSKNSRIRYRDLPTRRQGKYYLVDSKWLTWAKNNTGKLEKLDRESYLKLLQFTKAERKYKLPKRSAKLHANELQLEDQLLQEYAQLFLLVVIRLAVFLVQLVLFQQVLRD